MLEFICYNKAMQPTDDTTTNKTSNATLNKLRAAVLGANDGIVSTSSVVMGVAGASSSMRAIFTAGMAALVAGALSMAVGEYVSVSSQRDAEKANALANDTSDTEFTSPTQAAVASFIAFTVGGLVPFIAIIASPEKYHILYTVIAVLIALLITGFMSATVGGSSRLRAMTRVIVGGVLAMAVTYFVGALFGASFA